ncbi:MAG: type 1 glutamine amidotransferase [Bacteroidetes bacterium]|nr:type 1 glutamine amidotransferase [Bacteroidota bacterium]MCL5026689.1 type 1 glutamine amidotransferase [Chloroflexota bacterium]
MELAGKKIAVLAESEYDVFELWYPTIRMREAGAEVTIVGTGTSDTYLAGHGRNVPVDVDVAVDRITANDVDAVIIPGGYAPDRLRRYPAVLKLVKDTFQQGKVVAAICHAGWVLASAGVIRGKTMTCTAAIKDDMINAGAKYVDEEVVRDGNLITSRSPRDLPAFCRTIIAAMSEK